jgi:hypothetical protein
MFQSNIDVTYENLHHTADLYPLVKKLGNVVILMYTDETVLVLNNPTLLKTLWRPIDVCSLLVYFADGMLSPSHNSISVHFS